MIITLLSDFGYEDYTLAVAKGILLSALPDTQFIDISHEIEPFNLLQCGYFLKSSYKHFPPGTVHVSLFDAINKVPTRPIIARINGRYIITADNGLIPLTFNQRPEIVCRIGEPVGFLTDWIKNVAAFIALWQKDPAVLEDLAPVEKLETKYKLEPLITDDSMTCQIINIDRYGNVVINLSQEFFEEKRDGRDFRITFSRTVNIHELSQHYSDVSKGEVLCLFNLGGFMEIAVNGGSAAQLFGLTMSSGEQLVYKTIRIEFLEKKEMWGFAK